MKKISPERRKAIDEAISLKKHHVVPDAVKTVAEERIKDKKTPFVSEEEKKKYNIGVSSDHKVYTPSSPPSEDHQTSEEETSVSDNSLFEDKNPHSHDTHDGCREAIEGKKKKNYLSTPHSFRNIYGRMAFITPPELDKLASELVEWAIHDEDALSLNQFNHHHRICSEDMNRWMKDHEGLRRAHTIAKEAIGDRREIGALKNKYNTMMTCKTLSYYNTVFRDEEERRIALAKLYESKTENKSGVTVVYVNKAEETKEVPVLEQVPKLVEKKEVKGEEEEKLKKG